MLGEELTRVDVTTSGFPGDREFALIDEETGLVVSVERPHLWREMLQLGATTVDQTVQITLPDRTTITTADPAVDDFLSRAMGRRVHLSDVRPEGAGLARLSTEGVIDNGDEADLPFHILQMGQGTPGTSFVDYAPVHLVTTSTLDDMGEQMVRYRPNIVVATTSGSPFEENDWVGREITLGGVRLRGIAPTPRCAVPTLAHGGLPHRTAAVRTLIDDNPVDLPGFGSVPCLGRYAEVVVEALVDLGDEVHLH